MRLFLSRYQDRLGSISALRRTSELPSIAEIGRTILHFWVVPNDSIDQRHSVPLHMLRDGSSNL
jgi:hypothetical protein